MAINIWIRDPPHGLESIFKSIFTSEFFKFLVELSNKFDSQLEEIHLDRQQRNIEIHKNIWRAEFKNEYEDANWTVGKIPERLQNRKLDLGDVSPANTVHFIDALYCDVQGIQIDFDDGHCPTWRNTIKSYQNIYLLVQNQLPGAPPNLTNCPNLMFRPRALNMVEHNVMLNGKELNGALLDFAFIIYTSGVKLYELGIGPYFYLSKVESPKETKFWNEVFVYCQKRLGLPYGTIKCCVLIENILAAYQMTDILYYFKDHAIGLNFGMWDYCASIIAKFGHQRDMIFPDRITYINTSKPFLEKLMRLLIHTCHKRGALVTSGMAAQILSNDLSKSTTNKINEKTRSSKIMEIQQGFDGFLIYDFRLIDEFKLLWNENCPVLNQIRIIPTIKDITPNCLININKGSVTYEGINHNLNVSLLFIYHWLSGSGHFYYKNAVEDSATAEISRQQLWQWIRHAVNVNNEINNIVYPEFIFNELKTIVNTYFKNLCQSNADRKRLKSAQYILIEILQSKYPIEFITSFLNDNHKFRALHNKSDVLRAKL